MSTPEQDRLAGALRTLFGPLPGPALERLAGQAGVLHLRRGEVLYRQGDSGDSLHVVLTGRLAIHVHAEDGTSRLLAHAHPGETVGEMALLTGAPRAATLVAERDTTLAELHRKAFDETVAAHPAAVSHVTRMVIGRLTDARTRAAARPRSRSIAVVPLHAGLDAAAFCRQLRLCLLRFGSVLLLDAAQVSARLGERPDPVALERYLDECEERHDLVLLQAAAPGEGEARPGDPARERSREWALQWALEWTRKCAGHADHVLLVAPADAPPAPSALEQALFAEAGLAPGVMPDLVLVHEPGTRPSGTARWLQGRRVGRHYHVPRTGSEGYARLARFLCDRAVALVLAGGGARGFAHLGVVRALAEAGIPIDAVGGTSFGAIAATGPARGFEIEQMLEELRYGFTQERPLDDYTLPVVSLVRGGRLDELLQHYLDMDVEDLWIPWFAVSSNLSQNRVEVHERGPVWRGVRASVSLPAILPPVVHQGDLLVDGGVLNNLPVDVMRERVRGRIIAVDLSVEHEYRLSREDVPSGLDVLKSRLLPWREPLEAPTLARVVMKTTTLASRREVQLARQAAHLYLNVPLAEYDLLDWGRFHAIVDAGYRHATAELRRYVEREPGIVQRESLFNAAFQAA